MSKSILCLIPSAFYQKTGELEPVFHIWTSSWTTKLNMCSTSSLRAAMSRLLLAQSRWKSLDSSMDQKQIWKPQEEPASSEAGGEGGLSKSCTGEVRMIIAWCLGKESGGFIDNLDQYATETYLNPSLENTQSQSLSGWGLEIAVSCLLCVKQLFSCASRCALKTFPAG